MMRPLVASGLLLSLACGPTARDNEALLLDLAAQSDLAEIATETPIIDIGTPAARRFLGPGWSWNETGRSGATFAWSARQSSQISFFIARPRTLQVRLRCHPFRRDFATVDGLTIHVNGAPLTEVTLRPGWKEYPIEIPGERLASGINQMVFEYEWSQALEEPGRSRSGRRIAVAWDWIRFPEIAEGIRPFSTDEAELILTPGSQVEFFVATPGGTELVIDRIDSPGEEEAELELFVSVEGQDSVLVRRLTSQARSGPDASSSNEEGGYLVEENFRVPVTSAAELASLRFLAHGDFRLTRPRILTKTEHTEGRAQTAATPAPPILRIRPSLVLLYVIDTLRADHLTPYDYARPTSPGLTRLMADAVVFEDAMAQSSWTKPATASILTGLLPWSHGAERNEDALSGKIRPLAQYLADDGFATGGFSANGNISELFGFHFGFDHFSLMRAFDAPASEVQDEALQWLAEQDPTRPAFLYVHTIDPHAPYVSTERSIADLDADSTADRVGTVPFMRQLAKTRQDPDPALIDSLVDLYDGEIAFNDRQFAALLESLKNRGLYDQALILVASDHGEEFFDHGSWTHGRTLHEEVLHIPLLIKFPDNWAGQTRVADTVQQIDLLPTILDYLALPLSPDLAGQSLLCAVQQSLSATDLDCETRRPRPVFFGVHYHHNHWSGVSLGDWKLILGGTDRLGRRAKLFHRPSDPTEMHNLAAEHPLRAGYLASLIRAEMHRRTLAGGSQPVEIEADTRQRLEALGYLN